MSQLGFYFNMQACVGCRACQVSCKDKNRLEVGIIYRQANSYSVGTYPAIKGYHYSRSCNHCSAPACMTACPSAAILKLDDGTVVIDQGLCIGCDACVLSCPYGVPKLDEVNGVAGKCDACFTLRAKGENPACVDACPMRALDFGELEALKSKYGSGLTDAIAILPDPMQTAPSVLINAKDIAQDAGFKEIIL